MWQGTSINLFAGRGKVAPQSLYADPKQAIFYYQAPAADTGMVHIVATADGFSDTLALRLVPAGRFHTLSGIVIDDSTQTPIAGASIWVDDSIEVKTSTAGSFFIARVPPGQKTIRIRAKGYHDHLQQATVEPNRSLVISARLKAVLAGLLHQTTFILDTDSSQVNLDLMRQLAEKLRWAGATVYTVPHDSAHLEMSSRIDYINHLPDGLYLKLLYQPAPDDSLIVQTTTYPGNEEGETLARTVLATFERLPRVRTALLQNTDVPEVTKTNKTALELVIYSARPQPNALEVPAIFAGMVQFFQQAKNKTPPTEEQ